MKCLRCGQCCKTYLVVVVDDPAKGIVDGNLIGLDGSEPCPHLKGDTPGEYACAIHDEPWYPETPCFAHTQIENSPDDPCRTGKYFLDNVTSEKSVG